MKDFGNYSKDEWREDAVKFILSQFPRMSKELLVQVSDEKLRELELEALSQSDKGY